MLSAKLAKKQSTLPDFVLSLGSLFVLLCWAPMMLLSAPATAEDLGNSTFTVHAGQLALQIAGLDFRYNFVLRGAPVMAADPEAGLLVDGSPVTLQSSSRCAGDSCSLLGTNARGEKIHIAVRLTPREATFTAQLTTRGLSVAFRTGGASPAYGLADHAILDRPYNTDVTGFSDDHFLSGQGITRLVSNFIIYPRRQFALILIDPTKKIVHTSQQQIIEGVTHAGDTVTLHYFFGTPLQIYSAYRSARIAAGYKVWMPKYEMFGVGWEAFGALGWNTSQKTIAESIDRYLAEGYPLRWAVIGSGYWPADPSMHETTSFGLFDSGKYPDPRALFAHLHQEHLRVLLGLRITFITTGPFSAEGVKHGYFLEHDGKPEVFTGGWPRLPYYLLDAHNPAALNWYMSLVKRWQDFGVDGFKEDFFGFQDLRDDKVDPTNDRLMSEGADVIERNGYLSSNGDLHRINDFNFDQDQDRGPVNALALAWAGFPLVYPDIVGGTFGERRFDISRTPEMEMYMMRNARWASLHSSMGMGEPPWTFGSRVQKVMLASARFHARIAPYLYSQAQRFAIDGYPWTMIPLPLAFPSDPNVYGLDKENSHRYEWLIGDAILAAPIYGSNYATAQARDVYLPAGQWMDYDTGTTYTGNRFLRQFPMPAEKTPVFIGGSGVVLEQIGGIPSICIYPVATEAESMLRLPKGREPLTVAVHGAPPGVPWRSVRVTDTTMGTNVPVRFADHAWIIEHPLAGHRYEVQAEK